MGKQKHDLGVRKRALNAQANRRQKKAPDFRIGQPASAYYTEHYYGPPEHVREAAYALRQAGMPIQAQKVMDGLVPVEKIAPPEPPEPYDPNASGTRRRYALKRGGKPRNLEGA